MSRDNHQGRYLSLIRWQTAAIDTEGCYGRWPDEHRAETVAQVPETDRFCALHMGQIGAFCRAVAQVPETDRFCAHIWLGQSRYVLIENTNRDWCEKA